MYMFYLACFSVPKCLLLIREIQKFYMDFESSEDEDAEESRNDNVEEENAEEIYSSNDEID